MALRDSDFHSMVQNDRMAIFHPAAHADQFENELHSTFLPMFGSINSKIKQKSLVEHLLIHHVEQTKANAVENMVRKMNVLLEKEAILSLACFETVLRKMVLGQMDNKTVTETFLTRAIKNKQSGDGTYNSWWDIIEQVLLGLPVDILKGHLSLIQQIVSIFMESSKGLKRGYNVDTMCMVKLFGTFQGALTGCRESIRTLLESVHQGHNLQLSDARDSHNRNVLHMAVIMDSASLCAYICSLSIAQEALRQTDTCGRSPLFYCMSRDVVQILLKFTHLELNLQDKSGQTVTHFLVSQFQNERKTEFLEVLSELLRNPEVNAITLDTEGQCVFLRLMTAGYIHTEHKQNICQVLEVIVERKDFSLSTEGDPERTLLDILLQRKLFCVFPILAKANNFHEISLIATTAPKGLPLMHQVAMEGEFEDFESLLQHPDVSNHINELDSAGKSLLFYAIQRRCVNITELLLKLPSIDPNVCDSGGNTSLHLLAQETEFSDDGLECLLRARNLEINRCNEAGQTCVIIAAYTNNIKFLRSLLRYPTQLNINVKDRDGKTALRIALEAKQIPFLEVILRQKFTPETLGEAFIAASESGSLEVVKLILAHPDCNVNYQDVDGRSVMHYASKNHDHKEMMLALLDHSNIDLSLQDCQGYTPLMYGVTTLKAEDFRHLFEKSKKYVHLQNTFKQTVKDIFDNMQPDAKDPRIKTLICNSMKDKGRCNRLSSSDTELYEAIFRLRQVVQHKATFTEADQEELQFNLDYFTDRCEAISKRRHAHRAGMTDEHKKKLIQHRQLLVEEVEARDLTDYLIQESVLTVDQVEEIGTLRTRKFRIQALLLILPRCGPKAFEAFINALRKAKQDHVADAMMDTSQEVDNYQSLARSKDTAMYNLLSSLSECMLLYSGQASD